MFRRGLFRATAIRTRPRPSTLRLHLRHASSTGPPKQASETTRQKAVRYLTKPDAAPPVLARYPPLHFAAHCITWLVAGLLGLHVFFEYFYVFDPGYGISMLPTIASSGDWLLISKYYRRGREIGVGDVVSFKHPVRQGEFAVKRVLGMPGDFVLRDTPTKSNVMIQVPIGHCWLAGDNLTWSRDSRIYGPLPLALITGKVIAKVTWPMDVEKIEHGLKPAVIEEDVD